MDTYLTSPALSNFFSDLADPDIISMVKDSFFGGAVKSRATAPAQAAGPGAGRFTDCPSPAGCGRAIPFAPENRLATAVPGVFVSARSNGLRRTNWMLVWVEARLSCSACSGVVSRFTT